MSNEEQNGNFKKPILGVVLSYGLFFDPKRLEWILIEATKYDDNNKPISWAVRLGRTCMSKFTGGFDYEPMPSNRDDDFFNEYRFSTPHEAADCWSKHYSKPINLQEFKKTTGLFDRKGIELIEGDNFKYFAHKGYMLPDFTATVVWMSESACFGYKRHDMPEWSHPTPFVEHDELQNDFLNYIEQQNIEI